MSRARQTGVLALLAVLGVVSAAAVLLKERAPVPFRDTYRVHVMLAAADGVSPGLGQPVLVAGVQVGSITGERLRQGDAEVTMTIDRHKLPAVFRDARAALEPVTPLKDMRISLTPGTAQAGRMPDNGRIGIGRSTVPVPLADLLSALDGDTRAFLSSLIASMGEGTTGRGPDLRRALAALAPTTGQLRDIATALARRRHAIARLVHSVALITHAASDDRRLTDLVVTGHRTLAALAEQEVPLGRTLAALPGTLQLTDRTLAAAGTFSAQLDPALRRLMPAIRRLPASLDELGTFSASARRTLRDDLRPFVADAVPLARQLGPSVSTLRTTAPALTRSAQVLQYVTNELAYNPTGSDEGYLFWLPWFAHNFTSAFSASDAHGGVGRGGVVVSCSSASGVPGVDDLVAVALGTAGLCPDHPTAVKGR